MAAGRTLYEGGEDKIIAGDPGIDARGKVAGGWNCRGPFFPVVPTAAAANN